MEKYFIENKNCYYLLNTFLSDWLSLDKYHSSSIASRVEDLHEAFLDPNVKMFDDLNDTKIFLLGEIIKLDIKTWN